MPGKLKVKILAGRNLPVMDRSGDTTDAYVELKFNNITYKTDVCRKSLNPQWNSEWYKFEVDDAELQDEPLQIRLMDHDTYSANDAIGKVYLNLNPLLLPGMPLLKNVGTVEAPSNTSGLQGGSVLMGWIPVYDTMHGIRGEVNIIVKVELFIDFNKFKQSSCGVQFFYSPNIPHGYHAQVIHGFVEELIVTDDPEYKWIDKIRTPRASNEARQTLFFKLSGEVQRKIGLKALDLGGNAVIGYLQNFDLEGESGIVARGIGTAVTLVKLHDYSLSAEGLTSDEIALFLKSRAPFDFSDIDDSVPLLSRSPRHSPLSSSLPKLNSHFLSYTKHSKKTAVRVTEYRLSRKVSKSINPQMSIQSFINTKTSKSGDSSPSLSDYVLDDLSLKYIQDFDDVRKTTRSRFFSHDFKKHFKNLPQSILSGKKRTHQHKIKVSNSLDEESDVDSSTYSSSLSIGGSDSVDSSKKPCIKYKRFTHKKTTGDLMAASLIKSLHSGLIPLDSVKEVHESPAPSPVKFLEIEDSSMKKFKSSSETITGFDKPVIQKQLSSDERSIPMISSSETDTSTSDTDEDDNDDDPSELSMNYNILDDTVSLLEPKSTNFLSKDVDDEESMSLSENEEMLNKPKDYDSSQNSCSGTSESILDSEYLDVKFTIKDEENKTHKSPRKIERKATVIYKDLTKENKENAVLTSSQSLPTISIIIEPPSDEKNNNSMETELILTHKYRRQCMLELIHLIDTKMMINKQEKRVDPSSFRKTPPIPIFQTVNEHAQSPSNHSSAESLCKHVDFSISSRVVYDPNSIPFVKENNSSVIVTNVDDSSCDSEMHKIVAKKLAIDSQNSETVIDIELSEPKLAEFRIQDKLVSAKPTNVTNITDNLCVSHSPPTLRQQEDVTSSPPQATTALIKSTRSSSSTKTNVSVQIHRRSSDSDLSVSAKGNSLTSSDKSTGPNLKPSIPLVKTLTADMKPTAAIIRTMHQEAIEMLEYPFITMQQYPPGFILHIGGLVSARSVKLLERVNSLEEPEGRDFWWTEIRMEVRSHARSLGCNVLLGYREDISICDDVCVLSASGTAAVINMHNTNQEQELSRVPQCLAASSVESDREKAQPRAVVAKSEKQDSSDSGQTRTAKAKHKSESNDNESVYNPPNASICSLCHLPYSDNAVPFQMTTSKCAICRRAKVPDVLFSTIELPDNMPITGRGSFIQATVCKCKKDLRGELNAKEISDLLPFLEYELHSLLYNKLKVKGMNAIFGLKVQVSIGEKMMVGMAVGTAVYLTALPEPSVPQIASGNSWHDEEKLTELRKSLAETARKNREFYQVKSLSTDTDNSKSVNTSDTEESEDDLPDLDVACGAKDVCVLEVDDVEDMERINLLIDDRPPDDFHVVNTQTIPGLEDLEIIRNLQMFTQVSRAKIPAQPYFVGQYASVPSKYFQSVLQTIYFKLRRMVPCALCGLHFKVALPEQDEMQFSVVGMALGLSEATKLDQIIEKSVASSTSRDQIKKSDDSDMIFSLEEDPAEETITTNLQHSSTTSTSQSSGFVATLLNKARPRSPLRIKSHTVHRPRHVPIKERYGVDITPLSYLPRGKIERYLGNLNFFFIRESTSIRENGGLSGFTHSFMTEVLAIVRAHITALGGNAMVSFFMIHCNLLHSPHKNQLHCFAKNVAGKVCTASVTDRRNHPSWRNGPLIGLVAKFTAITPDNICSDCDEFLHSKQSRSTEKQTFLYS